MVSELQPALRLLHRSQPSPVNQDLPIQPYLLIVSLHLQRYK